MTTKTGSGVIALEEHYWHAGVAEHFTGRNATRSSDLLERLYDVAELRLKEMDEAGIDVQVLSHGAPSTQRLDAEIGPGVTAESKSLVVVSIAGTIRCRAAVEYTR